MNDWYESCINFLIACWWIYVIAMTIASWFRITTFVEFFMSFFVAYILIALPAIIRGRW